MAERTNDEMQSQAMTPHVDPHSPNEIGVNLHPISDGWEKLWRGLRINLVQYIHNADVRVGLQEGEE